MLENCRSAKERWGGVHDLIDRWLHERQELIVLYCNVTGFEDVALSNQSTAEKTQAFCQILMDYHSAGHFEVYEQLIEETQAFDDNSGVDLARELVPKIEQMTEVAVNFNDKYDHPEDNYDELAQELAADLSKLGEILEARFELEDRLIERLHIAHKELVA